MAYSLAISYMELFVGVIDEGMPRDCQSICAAGQKRRYKGASRTLSLLVGTPSRPDLTTAIFTKPLCIQKAAHILCSSFTDKHHIC